MLGSITPSEWARQLVRGAFDLHVHVAPDVMRRRITDLQLAHRCQEVGLAGFALKSHYASTAERAAVLNEILADGAADDQLALARGAFLECCFTTPFTGKYDWPRMADNISAAGPSIRS